THFHLQVEEFCPAVVTADERKFKQVLLNLLSNAVKFTPFAGAVHVLVSLVTDRRGPQFPMEEFLQVEVRDTGPGIDAKGQEKLFQEFSQLETSVKKSAGSGLGLVLSKRLVELHSGRIWLASEPGKGSRFIFAIPVGRPAAPK
ncbi:MAG: ATP-binding protein, partial [Firmicutes bacterium]|nr:ATP-binding protein [Bacillota bacterium]